MVPDAARPPSPPRPSQHEIHLSPAAARAHEPLVPVVDGGFGAITLRLLGGIGLDLVVARPTPNYDPRAGRCGAPEGRGWVRVEVH